MRACPFCGGKDSRVASVILPNREWVYYVVCGDCSGTGPKDENQDEAETRWDKRVIVP